MALNDEQIAHATYVALYNVAWLRYLTNLEQRETRAFLKNLAQPDREWKLQAIRDSFKATAEMLQPDNPFRIALENAALKAEEIVDGQNPPPIPDFWN